MENTYTYTARSVKDPQQVMTFTLLDHRLSVGLGPPLEQIEAALPDSDAEDEVALDESQAAPSTPWLKPFAVALIERGVGPFRVEDVSATVADDRLRVSAWYRAGGLALAPISLVDERVDNPPAAQAFVEELDRRKADEEQVTGLLKVLDYWLSWILAAALVVGLFQAWRHRANS